MTALMPSQGYFFNYRLQKKYEAIRRDLEPEKILGYLYQEEVIDTDDMDEVRAERTRKKKAEQLIEILQRKGHEDPSHRAMEVFVEVLEQRQPHLARILQTELDGEYYAYERKVRMNQNGNIGQVTSEMSKMYIQNPPNASRGKPGAVENESDSSPSFGSLPMKTAQPYSGGMVKGVQSDKLPPHIHPDHSDVYPMKRNPRGLAVIINNVNFSPKKEYTSKSLDKREGSEADVQKLKKLFQDLYFSVNVHEDLNGQELIDKVLSYSKENHSEYDAFVLCLMSHGQEDGILGTDGKNVDIAELRNMFNSSNCTTLTGKPKLIIVQACRGLKIDKGAYEVKDGPCGTETQKPEDEKKENWNLKFPVKKTIADAADFAIAHACVSGFASFRNIKKGSRFIQTMSEVFCECAGYEHLLDMLTKVNMKVSKLGDGKDDKQIPQPQSTLTKKLYFWPYCSTASPSTTVTM